MHQTSNANLYTRWLRMYAPKAARPIFNVSSVVSILLFTHVE